VRLPGGFPEARRVDVPVAEGTAVRLFINHPAGPPRGTVFILHGIAGSAASRLVVRCAAEAFRRGFVSVRVNNRNCGETAAESATLYNAGMSGDLGTVLESEPCRSLPEPHLAIGYSLGGNLLLKYLGEAAARADGAPISGDARPDGPGWAGRALPHLGRGTRLAAAAALSPPIDLDATERSLARAHNFVYEMTFVLTLARQARRRNRLSPGRYPAASIFRTPTLRSFDERFTAPDGGYAGFRDYYRGASSLPLLDRIRIPTLVLSSTDDPIVPARIFDGAAAGSPHIDWVLTESGGHCGWVTRRDGRLESLAPAFALDWLEAAISRRDPERPRPEEGAGRAASPPEADGSSSSPAGRSMQEDRP
jgi:predicted alpha/beta-fold hydrolase